MKKVIILSFCFFVIAGKSYSTEASEYELPPAVQLEMQRIAETYNVLDQVAEKVWPGWVNYRDFPFLLHFENGLQVLFGQK